LIISHIIISSRFFFIVVITGFVVIFILSKFFFSSKDIFCLLLNENYEFAGYDNEEGAVPRKYL
jgi:hypothetical protein